METERTPDAGVPERKVYKRSMIGLATFLGGPLAGGYMIAENFKAFEETRKVKKTWIYSIICLVLVLLIAFFIPEDSAVSFRSILPVTYIAVIVTIVRILQDEKINDHLDSGGERYGWGRTVAVGLIGLIVTLIVIFIVAFIMADLFTVLGLDI